MSLGLRGQPALHGCQLDHKGIQVSRQPLEDRLGQSLVVSMGREVAVIGHGKRSLGLGRREQSGLIARADGRLGRPRLDAFDHREEALSGLPGSLEAVLKALDGRITLDLAGRGADGELPERRCRLAGDA